MEYNWKLPIVLVSIASILIITYNVINEDILPSATMLLPILTTLPQVITVSDPKDRLIFIGDIHGQFDEFKDMLDTKIGKLDTHTTVVLLGDFLVKGPDSLKVVDYIVSHQDNIKFVFGNHEILLFLAYVQEHLGLGNDHLLFSTDKQFPPKTFKPPKKIHKELIKKLGSERLHHLASIGSVTLRFDLTLTNEVLFAVHAGMLPGDFMEKNQIPPIVELIDMKYVNEHDWTKSAREEEDVEHSKRWYKLWDDCDKKFDNITVLYGHDAKKGLNIRKHTKGLDSACVKGGQLTALEYTYDSAKGHYITTLHQVQSHSSI
ncbi:similar to Saccharomyces cerevisiae YNL217W Putative protein of unknown function [Maudiozyma barnettii]|uniref:Calcineurin-like phosphoesterase domain-containing protein n=1 Tax=Maudiozyma barnettii TaxID=61262 RepID=A0A8H2VE30_9SACH|nr:putative serine/threonine-protein phosphatase [Kazachstania barnettii]CAB4253857.1 similar to Saccharomyces cerevisiae YNL217W Putative protein of unknown function [Kazachstania barnettii]CAD1781607.1 similar to Saccharomyces cerevisiae YNL217W Putative protein of unknown function [Kazachstania barnettii]